MVLCTFLVLCLNHFRFTEILQRQYKAFLFTFHLAFFNVFINESILHLSKLRNCHWYATIIYRFFLYFTSFLLTALFCFRIQTKTSCSIQSSCFLSLFQFVTVSQSFLIFYGPDTFKGQAFWPGILKNVSIFGLSFFFS